MRLSDPYNVADLKPRAIGLAIFFGALVFCLLVRLWYLQIWRGDEYRAFSDRNRFKIKRISAPRGKIFDRNAKLLADNRPRFDVLYTRGFSDDPELELTKLKDIFGWSTEENAARVAQVKASAPYQSRRLARDISWDQLAKIESRSLEFLGVDVDVISVRDYLYGDAFFHTIGYTGEVDDRDLDRLQGRYPDREYRLGDQIGVIGSEALYEPYLRGRDGREFTVVDVKGRPVERTGLDWFDKSNLQEAVAGRSLTLSLDLELQLTAVRAFGENIGAAVALDPQTGEILAMVSRPALDPNLFTQQISGKQLAEWRDREDKPFLDRTLGEHYPPGSTFKIVMATAALETGVIQPDTIIYCPGSFRLGSRVWSDHNRAGFGSITVHDAIQRSSNVFFFNVGLMLGLDTMYHWSKLFGLGRRTNLGNEVFESDDGKVGKVAKLWRFNSEQSGFIPSENWVNQVGNTTIKAETINAGIGQGAFLLTITQLARMISILGNSGKVFQPQLLKKMSSADGLRERSFKAILENQIEFQEKSVKTVTEGIRAVVNDPGGTAMRARLKNYIVGGKTGTSQVVGLLRAKADKDREDYQDHALFVGMAPLEHARIAVAVIVEHGGHGGTTAAPIARAMMENYLSRNFPVEANLGQRTTIH
ncbi:MAG: penicillin-binding protein 2 [Deltaproteobacteria bacterium CG11_big_fil_rev_8_21_14_0_20_45_16]|nr:MAG: penicillin-binding protein 2 [Deltaproteobacteria bacterium CG11_big_fil_rev_8_21_14_0_20_45_16]